MISRVFKAFLSLFFMTFFLIIVIIIPLLSLGDRSLGNSNTKEFVTYGRNWTASKDVSMDGLRDTTLNGLQDLADWYRARTGEDLFITSGTDGDMHANAERGSHYSGDKLDVASDLLENEQFRHEFIAYAESKGIKVLDEYESPSPNSTGGHLDFDFTNYSGNSIFTKSGKGIS